MSLEWNIITIIQANACLIPQGCIYLSSAWKAFNISNDSVGDA